MTTIVRILETIGSDSQLRLAQPHELESKLLAAGVTPEMLALLHTDAIAAPVIVCSELSRDVPERPDQDEPGKKDDDEEIVAASVAA